MIDKRYGVTIYIHPKTAGPVTPMELNLMEVEAEVQKKAQGSDLDTLRTHEIAQRIVAKFPEVDPYSDLDAINALGGRLHNAYAFNGVVLYLSGSIKVKEEGSPTKATVEEVKRLTKSIQQLQSDRAKAHEDFLQERQKYNVAQASVHTLEGRNNLLVLQLNAAHTKIADLETQATHAQEDVRRLQDVVTRAKTEILRLREKLSTCETQLGAVHITQQQQTTNTDALYAQISQLRQELRDARQSEKIAAAELERYKQEITDLRTHLRSVTADRPDTRFNEGQEQNPFTDF